MNKSVILLGPARHVEDFAVEEKNLVAALLNMIIVYCSTFFRSLKTLPVKGKKGEVFRHPDIPPDVNEDTVNNNNNKNKKTVATKTIKI